MSGQLQNHLKTEIRRKFYLDSVALMRHSKALAQREGITEAAMMMGTPSNQAIMQNAGLLELEATSIEGGDLIISVLGDDLTAVESALAQASMLLDQPRSTAVADLHRARSVRGAKQTMPEANLTLISVPGEFAVSEARKALHAGMHAMIFSDNVALEAEAELKREAQSLGRLVMGPDCGTAIINGVPLAFANAVRAGNIGIIGASGTGIQEVTCLLDHAGAGISHAVGVGGRDLYQQVGGSSTLMALAALQADSRTEHIVIISKPPAVDVAAQVLQAVGQVSKPCTLCFLGSSVSDSFAALSLPDNATLTNTLKQTAEVAASRKLLEKEIDLSSLPGLRAEQQRIVGLFTGGTLCAEAQLILMADGALPASNVPVPGALDLQDDGAVHRLVDLGADEYTKGQPHPMIEPGVRDDHLQAALAQSDVAVVVLDVVLGYGSHRDPAGHLSQCLRSHYPSSDSPLIIASVTGTEADPQVRSRQIATLEQAGVVVVNANADALTLAQQYLSARRG